MTEIVQTFANHRRYDPRFHFFAVPVVVINLVVGIVRALRHATLLIAWWNVVVAAALVVVTFLVRTYALRNQDRIVRLEETLRLTRLLPEDLRARIPELRTSNLIAMRFCSDQELPDLARAVLDGEVTRSADIKRRIRQWRADTHRI